MKTEQILNETPRENIQEIWRQIQNMMTDLQDELYGMQKDPANGEIAKRMIAALDSGNHRAVHQLMQTLQ